MTILISTTVVLSLTKLRFISFDPFPRASNYCRMVDEILGTFVPVKTVRAYAYATLNSLAAAIWKTACFSSFFFFIHAPSARNKIPDTHIWKTAYFSFFFFVDTPSTRRKLLKPVRCILQWSLASVSVPFGIFINISSMKQKRRTRGVVIQIWSTVNLEIFVIYFFCTKKFVLKYFRMVSMKIILLKFFLAPNGFTRDQSRGYACIQNLPEIVVFEAIISIKKFGLHKLEKYLCVREKLKIPLTDTQL